MRALVGNVTLTVDWNGIRRSNKSPKRKSRPNHFRQAGADVDATSGTTAVTPELDLRGLDQQNRRNRPVFSQALESGWEEGIVHGKGVPVYCVAIKQLFIAR
ncbi:MAG: hypothetical protein R3C41_11665 [Calditrichia bacterium]